MNENEWMNEWMNEWTNITHSIPQAIMMNTWNLPNPNSLMTSSREISEKRFFFKSKLFRELNALYFCSWGTEAGHNDIYWCDKSPQCQGLQCITFLFLDVLKGIIYILLKIAVENKINM